eukprot:TRINITY_DN9240_c0_g1_i4.p1 TRINITY_DN9240_c0_g1~~TRINITY_DN9240_c0_g1_i4.p1  ORF type:complete len:111 (-),score=15.62 TRINITY_DN9240_c0_g1_i4:189-521(-)
MAQIIKRLLWWSDNKVEKGQSQIRKPLSTEFENTILSMLEEAIEDANLVGNRHDINFNPILARKDYLASIIERSILHFGVENGNNKLLDNLLKLRNSEELVGVVDEVSIG